MIMQEAIFATIEQNYCVHAPAKVPKQEFPSTDVSNFAEVVIYNETGELMEYQHLLQSTKYQEVWGQASGNEISRLVQGMSGCVEETNTIFFIYKVQVKHDRFHDDTYGKFVVDYREDKDKKERLRLTVGGDWINYLGEVLTPTADLLVIKLMLNSVISTPHAQ